MVLNEDAVSGIFPDAAYLVLSSRLVPGLDGGYTIGTLARARQMAARGADVQVLTVDPADAAVHAEHRAEFARRRMLTAGVPMRNLFDEARAPGGGAAEWLLRAAAGAAATAPPEQRILADAEGRPFIALPVISGDPDWLLTRAAVSLFDDSGAVAGELEGFGALYRAWLERIADDSERPVVVICESRQLGELLAGWSHPRVRIVHMIHTMHLEPPYSADAQVNALWSRWFALSDRFDAVVWPTQAQRDAVSERFGDQARNLVAPNGVEMSALDRAAFSPSHERESERTESERTERDTERQAELHEPGLREPGLLVSLSRLAAGKRIDHAIRAFAAADVPGARFEVWGDGPETDHLAALIAELGVGDRVVLRGSTTSPAEVLARASLFVTATAFEGQGLSIIEALASGVPAVSYDVRFGPGDILAGGGGVLVSDGDEPELSQVLRTLLTDEDQRSRLAGEARASAAAWSDEAAMTALAAVMRDVLNAPPRR